MPEIASSYDHARFMNDAWRNKEMDLGEDPGMYGIYTEEELQKFRDGSDLTVIPIRTGTKKYCFACLAANAQSDSKRRFG